MVLGTNLVRLPASTTNIRHSIATPLNASVSDIVTVATGFRSTEQAHDRLPCWAMHFTLGTTRAGTSPTDSTERSHPSLLLVNLIVDQVGHLVRNGTGEEVLDVLVEDHGIEVKDPLEAVSGSGSRTALLVLDDWETESLTEVLLGDRDALVQLGINAALKFFGNEVHLSSLVD